MPTENEFAEIMNEIAVGYFSKMPLFPRPADVRSAVFDYTSKCAAAIAKRLDEGVVRRERFVIKGTGMLKIATIWTPNGPEQVYGRGGRTVEVIVRKVEGTKDESHS